VSRTKAAELGGTEASPTTTITGEGIVKPGVGKYPKVLGLSQGTNLRRDESVKTFLLPNRG
jgi:hypothetical protein